MRWPPSSVFANSTEPIKSRGLARAHHLNTFFLDPRLAVRFALKSCTNRPSSGPQCLSMRSNPATNSGAFARASRLVAGLPQGHFGSPLFGDHAAHAERQVHQQGPAALQHGYLVRKAVPSVRLQSVDNPLCAVVTGRWVLRFVVAGHRAPLRIGAKNRAPSRLGRMKIQSSQLRLS
jgi:hypothetical protein